ncbi:MAG: substrate-binding periplasmic protein [Actinomycetota bacterium]
MVAYVEEYPFSSLNEDATLGGIDGEIIARCCKRLSLPQPSIEEIWLNEVEEVMASERYDLVTCSLAWSQKRASLAAPSVPLFLARNVLFVPKGNPATIHSMNDLIAASFSVGAIGEGTEDYIIRERVGDQRVVNYQEQTSMWRDLIEGRIGGAYFERSAGLAYLAEHPDAGFELADPFEDPDAPRLKSALWFRRSEADIAAAFNSVLETMKETGELERILAQYGIPPDEIMPVGDSFP